jgi:hypothetical protein
MTRLYAILLLISALAFAASPWLTPGFNGFSADQFPVPQDNPPIQPVGWAFSIWGLIYGWLIISAAVGLIRHGDDPAWDAARRPLILSLVLGAFWIPLANLSPIWATLMIWVMWATAVRAMLKAPTSQRLSMGAPIGIYAGWLSAASPVGTAIVLTGYGVEPVVTIHAAVLIAGLAFASFIIRMRPDPAYAAALIWALMGIALSNLSPAEPLMIALPLIGIVAIALPVLAQIKASTRAA